MLLGALGAPSSGRRSCSRRPVGSSRCSASQLGVAADWQARVRAAAAEGGGFGPVRGFRRLRARLFGADVSPPVQAYDAAVELQARPDRTRGRSAAASMRSSCGKGSRCSVVEGRSGRELDRAAAAAVVVRALARLRPRRAGGAPARDDRSPGVSGADLATRRLRPRTALSAPDPPRRTARPAGGCRAGGSRRCSSCRPAARRERLDRRPRGRGVPRAAVRDRLTQAAGRAVPGHGDRQDRDQAVGARARSSTSPRRRRRSPRPRSRRTQRTAQARRPGRRSRSERRRSRGRWGSPASSPRTRRPTAGTPGGSTTCSSSRRLIDGTLIKPGATFSFNETTGERTAAKGFQEAPVIINGELQNGLGGGICQVSTTVFNAAFDGGPADHGPDESRPLHQPLPARPRRDRRTTPISTSGSRTTPTTGCCCAPSSAPGR